MKMGNTTSSSTQIASLTLPLPMHRHFTFRASTWISEIKPRPFEPAPPSWNIFLNIPEELVLMITQFLDVNALLAVMRVNRRFHRIALPVLWKETMNKPDIRGQTWLHRAAQAPDADMVKRLIAMGANILAIDHCGMCPAVLAGREGHAEIVLAFLDAEPGLEESCRQREGSILHAAAFLGDYSLVQKILSQCSFLTRLRRLTSCDFGMSLLHSAAYGGNVRIIQVFIGLGVDPNASAMYGITPLHVAAFNGHLSAVNLLANLNTKLNKMDAHRRSAWSLAKGAGHGETADLLLRLGAPRCGRYKRIPSFLFGDMPGIDKDKELEATQC